MAYVEKIEGSLCTDCGKAKIIKSPKTGKTFCADKCWLQGQQPVNLQEPKNDVDWDKIATGKVRHAFAVEAFKMKMPLDEETKKRINNWTEFVMDKPVSDEEKVIQVEQPTSEKGLGENIPF